MQRKVGWWPRLELKGACHVKRLPRRNDASARAPLSMLLEPRHRGSFFLPLASITRPAAAPFSRTAPLLRATQRMSRFPEYPFSKFFGGFSERAEAVLVLINRICGLCEGCRRRHEHVERPVLNQRLEIARWSQSNGSACSACSRSRSSMPSQCWPIPSAKELGRLAVV